MVISILLGTTIKLARLNSDHLVLHMSYMHYYSEVHTYYVCFTYTSILYSSRVRMTYLGYNTKIKVGKMFVICHLCLCDIYDFSVDHLWDPLPGDQWQCYKSS